MKCIFKTYILPVIFWLYVLIPLGWGISKTLYDAAKLFAS